MAKKHKPLSPRDLAAYRKHIAAGGEPHAFYNALRAKKLAVPRAVAARENWPRDYWTGEPRPPSPRQLLGDIDYQRLIKIMQLAPSKAQAARDLGVSPRTLGRYLDFGIPPGAKLSRVKQAAIHRVYVKKANDLEMRGYEIKRKEVFIQRHLSNTRTDTYYIDGADTEDVKKLLYNACLSQQYMTYSMTLKFDLDALGIVELKGFFDKYSGQFVEVDSKEWKEMKKGMTKAEREALSFVVIAAANPFLSTDHIPIQFGDMCSADEYADQINHAFGRPYTRPVSIVFYKPRMDSDEAHGG